MRGFDGQYRWFLFRASPLRDESGKIIKWYGTNVDIDDRKRAEEVLGAVRPNWQKGRGSAEQALSLGDPVRRHQPGPRNSTAFMKSTPARQFPQTSLVLVCTRTTYGR